MKSKLSQSIIDREEAALKDLQRQFDSILSNRKLRNLVFNDEANADGASGDDDRPRSGTFDAYR